ncbi:hypothetical protein RERY_42320 [Rhodococcus erythropolis]|nr:hypothetical protein RERY_42320 [Rhodococcus erythropolis]
MSPHDLYAGYAFSRLGMPAAGHTSGAAGVFDCVACSGALRACHCECSPRSDAAYSCGTVAAPDFTHVRCANEDNANDPIARLLPPLEPLCGEALHESKKHILAIGVAPILTGIGLVVGVVRMVLAFRRRSSAWDRWKLLPPMTNTGAIIVSFAALVVVLVAPLLQRRKSDDVRIADESHDGPRFSLIPGGGRCRLCASVVFSLDLW